MEFIFFYHLILNSINIWKAEGDKPNPNPNPK